MNERSGLLERAFGWLMAGDTLAWTEPRTRDHALLVTRLLYAAGLVVLMPLSSRLVQLSSRGLPYPLWPVKLLGGADPDVWQPLVGVATATTLLLAAVWPHVRSVRVAVVVLTTLWGAAMNSGGKIEHAWHPFVITYALLAFAPRLTGDNVNDDHDDDDDVAGRVWLAQAAFMLTYSMAGLWKVAAAVFQVLVRRDASYFSVDGLSRQVADRALQAGDPAWLGEVVVATPWLGFIAIWLTIYLELFSVVVAFRPSLHRVWGASLLAMHLGIDLTMGITFRMPMLLAAILMIGSPFAPSTTTAGVWRLLPGAPLLLRVRTRLRRGSSPADGSSRRRPR